MSAPARQDDAELIEAERRLAELRSCESGEGDIWPLVDTIALTPPRTVAGAAAKLRLLCDDDIGILAGNSDADETSLRQVLTFVEALARRVAPG